MNCFNSCLIACSLLGSKILIMGSSRYSKNRQLLVESLDETQQKIYHGIAKQRAELFIQGLIFGCTLGALSLYVLGAKNNLSATCLFITISMLVTHYYYLLMPKKTYLLEHLEKREQLDAWLNMYKEMNFKSHIGSLLGGLAFLFVCKTVSL